MKKVLIIGAGAARNVTTQKCAALPHIFKEIHLASRTLSKCEQIKNRCQSKITIHQIDADNVKEVVTCIQNTGAELVINLALPYQDLSIMEACLETGAHYIDTANYESKDDPKFCYKWQWDYHERFKEKGLLALLGCGFDPGVTNVFCAYAQKHHFDEIHTIDIVDCNDGDHGYKFATNFNPEINIREITANGRFYRDGKWEEIPALSESKMIDYPNIGERNSYLIYHEELESLVKNIPGLKQIRFWMTFSDS